MKQLLIFAGTTEGRQLVQALTDYQVEIHACVATEYGKEVLPQSPQITVHTGRLTQPQMAAFLQTQHFACVIDATHPFATEVTQNITQACQATQTPYLRLLRQSGAHNECITVASAQQAAEYLNGTQGNVLLTTGSKELAAFTAVNNFKERLYARVLPMASVIEQCTALGFTGKHLICMQGPFSLELNRALLRQINASYLVTKDSGSTGGVDEKLQAAQAENVTPILIGRPMQETGCAPEQALQKLVHDFTLQKKENHTTPYFPFFCNIKDKHILVLGGGSIAQRRIETLLPFGCHITVIAPQCTSVLQMHAAHRRITLQNRPYQSGDCTGFDFVLAATNVPTVNEAAAQECRNHSIPVNLCHNKTLCDFYFPAIVRQQHLVVGISASGANHRQASQVAARLRAHQTQLLSEED